MAISKSEQYISGSIDCNSNGIEPARIVRDLIVLDQVITLLDISLDDSRSIPEALETAIETMSVDELGGLLEYIILQYLVIRSRPA